MTYRKLIRISFIIALIIMALSIFWLSGFHDWIEQRYATTFFPVLGSALRFLFGWIPFSIGDLMYSTLGILFVYQLGLFLKGIFQKGTVWHQKLQPLNGAVLIVLFVYVYFYLFWGLNYYRRGIEFQLKLEPTTATRSELLSLNALLISRLNASKQVCLQNNDTLMTSERMFSSALEGYHTMEAKFSFIRYRYASLKPSLFGKIGNYVGFQGYYNPFTGEAQINTRIPNFVQPFVTCHEMAHQLGYASESEANFVGFLAAIHSKDKLLQYSSYLDMFLSSWNNLHAIDSVAAKELRKELHEGVRRDLRTYKEFVLQHRTFLQNWTNELYDYYLRKNRQRKGIGSYNEVTGWLIAYHKKFHVL